MRQRFDLGDLVVEDTADHLDIAAVALGGHQEHIAAVVGFVGFRHAFGKKRGVDRLKARGAFHDLHARFLGCLQFGGEDDRRGDRVDVREQRRDHQTDGGEHRNRLHDVFHDLAPPISGLERVILEINGVRMFISRIE